MKKRTTKTIAAVLSLLLLLAVLPAALASEDGQNVSDAHGGHSVTLEEILTGEDCETDFCGRFYCSDCDQSYFAPISCDDVGMPIVNLKGSLNGISKTNKVTVAFDYLSGRDSFSSSATLKVQGSTSASFPKKNYTVQFLKENGSKNKVKLVDSWGKQSKYCLKANWVDFSQARNVVSGQLFNQIVHSRCIDDELNALSNGGVVDGYPVLVYLNGDFLGLYTMNIPKDNWMFGMNDASVKQALLFANNWNDSPALRQEISDVNDVTSSGWELEYCSTEDDKEIGTAWAAESMNNFIRFLLNNDGESFKNGISAYTDVDRAIDALIFTYFIYAGDNTSKNTIWATYDGVKWIPSVYDLDGTWGLIWNGSVSYPVTGFTPDGRNLLNERLFANYKNEITARYLELREDILSVANINKMFDAFFAKIPQIVYEAEAKRWPASPSHEENTPTQIKEYAKARAEYNDGWYGVTVKEKQESAYKVSFSAPTGVKIYVYPAQDYSEAPVRAASAFSVTKDGELTKSDGQVNFRIEAPEGYEVSSVAATPENYKNIKGPADTEQENTYRITKITGDITVSIDIEKPVTEPEGYNAAFEGEHIKVYVFPGQDYSKEPELSDTAVSLDSDTGLPTKSGDGQINFLVVPEEGYTLTSVTASPKNYKNIKAPDETGAENVYRITKITGDLTVSISAKPITSEPTTAEPTTAEPTSQSGRDLIQKITSWFRNLINKIKDFFSNLFANIK